MNQQPLINLPEIGGTLIFNRGRISSSDSTARGGASRNNASVGGLNNTNLVGFNSVQVFDQAKRKSITFYDRNLLNDADIAASSHNGRLTGIPQDRLATMAA